MFTWWTDLLSHAENWIRPCSTEHCSRGWTTPPNEFQGCSIRSIPETATHSTRGSKNNTFLFSSQKQTPNLETSQVNSVVLQELRIFCLKPSLLSAGWCTVQPKRSWKYLRPTSWALNWRPEVVALLPLSTSWATLRQGVGNVSIWENASGEEEENGTVK